MEITVFPRFSLNKVKLTPIVCGKYFEYLLAAEIKLHVA